MPEIILPPPTPNSEPVPTLMRRVGGIAVADSMSSMSDYGSDKRVGADRRITDVGSPTGADRRADEDRRKFPQPGRHSNEFAKKMNEWHQAGHKSE